MQLKSSDLMLCVNQQGNKCSGKSSKSTCLTCPCPQYTKSNAFIFLTKNVYVPFICSLNMNFSKAQNQLDECHTFEDSRYKCKQYIASYNCQNMLKSLSFIRQLFSSNKLPLPGSSILSSRVRDIPGIDSLIVDHYGIARSIHVRGNQAEIISILKLNSLFVIKSILDLDVNSPSPLPELRAIRICLEKAKKMGMRGFIVYFQNGTISKMSSDNIQNPIILKQFQCIDQLLNQCDASLCHNPKLVSNHPVVREAMSKRSRP